MGLCPELCIRICRGLFLVEGGGVDMKMSVGVLCTVYSFNAATVVAVGSREAW